MARFRFATLAAFFLFGTLAYGQGIVPFKTTQNNGADIIDLSTLNVIVSPTLRSKPGRFSVGQTINSNARFYPVPGTIAESNLGKLDDNPVPGAKCPNG